MSDQLKSKTDMQHKHTGHAKSTLQLLNDHLKCVGDARKTILEGGSGEVWKRQLNNINFIC